MKIMFLAGASALGLSLAAVPALAQTSSDAEPWKDVIVVHGAKAVDSANEIGVPALALVQTSSDVAGLAFRIPGGAMNGNGPLSGQVQYRGLYGYRIASRISGQSFASGGPNLMDPPMHYAPMPLLERMEFDRSFSPVSEGPGLVGGVNAVLKRGDFGASDAFEAHVDASLGLRSVNESIAVGGLGYVGNQTGFLQALVSHESGDNIDFPGGSVASSSHERDVYGIGFGVRPNERLDFFFEYRHHNTGPTGNPPFPMDITFFKTDIARAEADGNFGAYTVEARLGWSFVDHEMTNFKSRPDPATPAGFRTTLAGAHTWSYGLSASRNLAAGDIKIGVDGSAESHSVRITNPNNPGFLIRNFHHNSLDRVGLYLQLNQQMQSGLQWELGARLDQVDTDADVAVASAILSPPVRGLANAFSAADRSRSDTVIDLTARMIKPVLPELDLRIGLARKNRVPNYVERYGWLPTSASAGLADGNIYVGDINLRPETALIANLGLDWNCARAFARLSIFVQRIDDYIQGVPFDDTPGVINTPVEMIANMNGDPTPLRFANVDAELIGFDMDFGYEFSNTISVDGVVSLVSGNRRDIDDKLYRVAPARLTTNLRYDQDQWGATLQGVFVADKSGVSLTNEEQASDGYVLANLEGYWHPRSDLVLTFGLENVFDTLYVDHLAAYNRIRNSDVALGDRLPGSGRGVHIRLTITR
jgi:iron complex outermembrane receptor protein